jgi:hypothetical protein
MVWLAPQTIVWIMTAIEKHQWLQSGRLGLWPLFGRRKQVPASIVTTILSCLRPLCCSIVPECRVSVIVCIAGKRNRRSARVNPEACQSATILRRRGWQHLCDNVTKRKARTVAIICSSRALLHGTLLISVMFTDNHNNATGTRLPYRLWLCAKCHQTFCRNLELLVNTKSF